MGVRKKERILEVGEESMKQSFRRVIQQNKWTGEMQEEFQIALKAPLRLEGWFLSEANQHKLPCLGANVKREEFGFNKAWDFARRAQQKEREAKILESLQKNDYNHGPWTSSQEKARQVCKGGENS